MGTHRYSYAWELNRYRWPDDQTTRWPDDQTRPDQTHFKSFNTLEGGTSHENKKLSFPFSTIGIKSVGSFVGISYRPDSIPMTFCVEYGFFVAQFDLPYPLHISSYEFSRRTWVFLSPIFCAITVPMISLVELATCTNFSKHWEILSWVLKPWVWWGVAPPCLLRFVRVTMAALLNLRRRSRCLQWSS